MVRTFDLKLALIGVCYDAQVRLQTQPAEQVLNWMKASLVRKEKEHNDSEHYNSKEYRDKCKAKPKRKAKKDDHIDSWDNIDD